MSRASEAGPARRRLAAALRAAAFGAGLLLTGGAGHAGPAPGPAGEAAGTTVAVVGYNDMDEMLAALTDRYAALHPGTRFSLTLKGTRTAPAALTAGTAALAPMGAEMEEADLAAYRARWHGEPVAVAVAHASLKPGTLSSPTGVFVHHTNPLRRISLAALRGVLLGDPPAGAIGRWDGLGLDGPWRDRPIHPVGLGEGTAIGRFMLRHHLRAEAFGPAFAGFGQSREVAAAIAADPLAIGFANLNHVRPEIRALRLVDDAGNETEGTEREIRAGRYPLDRRLLIYARCAPDGRIEPAQSFLAFALSDEGQGVIASGSRGYMPLGPARLAQERAKLERCGG